MLIVSSGHSFKGFLIKDLARSVAVHILFDLTENIVDETAATFEPIHKHSFTKRMS